MAPRAHELASRHATILVVEDDPVTRTLCMSCLKKAGFTILEATGSAEAHIICKEHRGNIDLIILDIVLYPIHVEVDEPANTRLRLHGDTLLPILRVKRPLTRLLLMSATSLHTLGGRGMGWLVRQYPFLLKPFTSETLLRTVTQVLESPIPAFKPAYGGWQGRR
jgi:CheY-like chemotaxis protein